MLLMILYIMENIGKKPAQLNRCSGREWSTLDQVN